MYLADKKVAVLSPASAAGVVGGAERFYAGLIGALEEAGCAVSQVDAPVDESTFDGILAAYDHFSRLDLSEYDLVVSTKAPTYAVRHPNHLLYLVHTVRVFYDMFGDVFPNADETLKSHRETVHALDNDAFSRIKARFSIGHEVSARLRKWNGVDAEVLHPPLATSGFRHAKSEGYFFLPGRLHGWKRVDLAIKAVLRSSLPMRLIVAGTGDAESELKDLAAGDPRITFAGRVSDDELVDLYARALAVPFVPLREDYGYVTLEAFASGKPVITCTDSGEPLQFVEHEQSGLVAEPTPESLCTAMERLYSNPRQSALMGERGRFACSGITWTKVASRLLEAGFSSGRKLHASAPIAPRRISTAVLDMQPIEPAVGGGRLRLLGVFHALGPDIDAHYVGTYDWPGESFRQHRISPGLVETDVPLSDVHHAAAAALSARCFGKTVIDVAFPAQCHLSPDYIAKAREAVTGAQAVVLTHPWVYPLIQHDIRPEQVVVYDAHNVEGLLRAQLLDERNPVERDLIRLVVETEYELCRRADLIFTCSKEEVDQFVRLYGVDRSRIHVVPNGAMASAFATMPESDRLTFRRSAGIGDRTPVAFFIGSPYGPNVDAARFIAEELAPAVPEVVFVIGGGVGAAIEAVHPNVRITGPLTDAQRGEWLNAADLAVNPMFAGSGTNIKMFDFMSASLPIVTTPVGARGITAVSGGGIRLAGRGEFGRTVHSFVSDLERLRFLGSQNREWMEQAFAWETISPRAGDLIRSAVHQRSARSTVRSAQVPRPRIAHFTTLGQRCGIGEYTGRLLEEFATDGLASYVITCATPSLRPARVSDMTEGEIGWYWDNETWTGGSIDPGVVQRTAEWGATDVVIQYHAAFFSGERLVELARSFMLAGVAVTVVVHNLEGVDWSALRSLRREGCLLLSHSRREVTQARGEGVDLVRMPHLVPVASIGPARSIRNRDLSERPPLIATTGFIRPHKGIVSLIESMPQVRARLPGARLLLQCALYPSDDSRQELESCRKAVERLGLEGAIDLDTEFRPIEYVHDRLASADLGVLPYGPSNEGGSGSAATLLAAGLPVLLSDSPVFADLLEAADVLTDVRPSTIAAAIVSAFESPQRYDALAHRAHRYVGLNSAPAIAARLLGLLEQRRDERSLAEAA